MHTQSLSCKLKWLSGILKLSDRHQLDYNQRYGAYDAHRLNLPAVRSQTRDRSTDSTDNSESSDRAEIVDVVIWACSKHSVKISARSVQPFRRKSISSTSEHSELTSERSDRAQIARFGMRAWCDDSVKISALSVQPFKRKSLSSNLSAASSRPSARIELKFSYFDYRYTTIIQ